MNLADGTPVPDVCWYCHGNDTDHKHGSGRSCMNCCATHGKILTDDRAAYEWVRECLRAKNEALARSEARAKALEEVVATKDKTIAILREHLALAKEASHEDSNSKS